MSDELLRAELVQVAAVAVAMVEDLDYGIADTNRQNGVYLGNAQSQTLAILDNVHKERMRQDEKWGPQHHDPFTWLTILMEEVGEAAEEIDSDYAPIANENLTLAEDLADSRRAHMWIVHAGNNARAWLHHRFGA